MVVCRHDRVATKDLRSSAKLEAISSANLAVDQSSIIELEINERTAAVKLIHKKCPAVGRTRYRTGVSSGNYV